MKVVTVLGARPQFIKAAPLSRCLRKRHEEILVHTGQHYDENLSGRFFQELGIPEPDVNLGVGSARHGAQTGAMLEGIEAVIEARGPDAVLVYGDTNSTLAGALAAAKCRVPVAHVEAGLRSFNRSMPEEINRVVADHLAYWLFAPSESARRQLAAEGITRGVHVVGDIMLDSLRLLPGLEEDPGARLAGMGLEAGRYFLCTLHRAENTDERGRLAGILEALGRIPGPVVLPLHPRTRARMEAFNLAFPPGIQVLEPLGYLDLLRLLKASRCVLTDSGGIQKEAYYLSVPCITLRDETEWTETLETGWNRLAGAEPGRILEAAVNLPPSGHPHPDLYGDGRAAERIVDFLEQGF